MSYDLEFLPSALKEWKKLSPVIRFHFKKKLHKILANPRIQSAKLRDMEDCYKIKLRSSGYRLVYKIIDSRLVVQVVAVGKRELSEIYKKSKRRI